MKSLRWAFRLITPLAILAIGFGGLQYLSSMRPEPERAPETRHVPVVATHTVEIAEETLVVRTYGTVTPRAEIRLVAEVSGRVVEVAPNFAAGGFFEKGDVLMRLEDTDYQAAAKQTIVRLRQAELQIAQEKADAEVARKDWEANRSGQAPPLVLRIPQLAKARAELESAQASLAKAQRDVERCNLVAPFAGRLRGTSVDVGQYVPKGGMLAEAHATDHAEVRLPLPEKDLAFLDLPLAARRGGDDPAPPRVRLRGRLGGEDFTWDGTLVRTEGELDPKNRMLFAVARVDDPYGRLEKSEHPPLLIGMFVEAEITGRTVEAARLPREALNGSSRVLVVRDGQVHFRQVRVLQGSRDDVLVTGLSSGDEVIVTPLESAVDGMDVRATQDSD